MGWCRGLGLGGCRGGRTRVLNAATGLGCRCFSSGRTQLTRCRPPPPPRSEAPSSLILVCQGIFPALTNQDQRLRQLRERGVGGTTRGSRFGHRLGVPAHSSSGWTAQRRRASAGNPSGVEHRLRLPACCVRFDLGPLDLPPCRAKRAGLNARSPTNFRGQIPQVKSDTTREGPVSPRWWVGHASGKALSRPSWWAGFHGVIGPCTR